MSIIEKAHEAIEWNLPKIPEKKWDQYRLVCNPETKKKLDEERPRDISLSYFRGIRIYVSDTIAPNSFLVLQEDTIRALKGKEPAERTITIRNVEKIVIYEKGTKTRVEMLEPEGAVKIKIWQEDNGKTHKTIIETAAVERLQLTEEKALSENPLAVTIHEE